jgi:predicted metal-dependent hydrolase
MLSPLLLTGIAEFNCGHFFEAHELWEELWGEAVGEEKRFYQGLVQLAAGYHKLSLDQRNGARKLLERGWQTLSTFPPHYAELHLPSFLPATATVVQQLIANQPLISPLPQIAILPASS